MLYVGWDLHLQQIVAGVLDENGKPVLKTRVRNAMELVLTWRGLGDRLTICFEASGCVPKQSLGTRTTRANVNRRQQREKQEVAEVTEI